MDETATFSDKMEGVGNQSGGQMKASRLLNRSQVWGRFIRRKLSSFQSSQQGTQAAQHASYDSTFCDIHKHTDVSELLSDDGKQIAQSSNKNGRLLFDSWHGSRLRRRRHVGGGGTYAPGMGGGSGGTMSEASCPVEGGSSGTSGGGTSGGGTSGGGTSGGDNSAVSTPVDGGGSGSGGMVGGGNTGVNPGGSTGGSGSAKRLCCGSINRKIALIEEGEKSSPWAAYAMKGIDVVSYQWFKNGVRALADRPAICIAT
jgi:hypothetical protein